MRGRGRPKHPDILTPREWEVLALLREGRANEEIAEQLGITLRTARFHVSEIIGKLGVADRHEAAAWEPEREAARGWRAWALAPIAAMHHAKLRAAALAFGALVTASALVLVALLAWGVTKSGVPASSIADAAICTPGPTDTPYPPSAKGTPLPPDLRPDSERMADIVNSQRRRLDWTNAWVAAGCDPHALPNMSFAIVDLFAAQPQTIDEVITRSDAVIVGHVTSVKFHTDLQSSTSPVADEEVTVDRTLRGAPPDVLRWSQEGGPIPDHGGVMDSLPADRVLLPGDQVLLILAADESDPDAYRPLYPVGKYEITNGIVFAVDGNPCTGLDGLSVAQAEELITAPHADDAHLTAPCDWSRFE